MKPSLAQQVAWAKVNGKKYPLCWWCNGKLVGPGGVAGKEPLVFRLFTPPYATTPVKVHVTCEKDAKAGEDFSKGER
jgi:hypothetical protein